MHEPEPGNRESRQRVLVIDDNEAFLRNTKTALAVAFEVETLHIGQGSRAEDIADRVVAFRPEQILLDVNLTGGFSSRDLLRALVERRVLDRCEVRLISFGFSSGQGRGGASQGGADSTPRGDGAGHAGDPGADALAPAEAVIASFQALSIRVKGPLIRKPIDAYDLMAALVGVDPFDPPDYWSDFPLPLRVLGRRRAPDSAWMCPVLYANPAWTQFGADPVQPSSSLFPDWRERGKVPEPLERIGNPFDPNYSSYVLRSFPIEQDGQELLGQVVEHRAFSAADNDLKHTIDDIFEAMAQAGFTTGQCYLIEPLIVAGDHPVAYRPLDQPPADAESVREVAVLYRLSKNHPQTLRDELPMRQPLRGALRGRAEQVLDELQTAEAKTLVYRIHTAANDALEKDEDLRRWSQWFKDWLPPGWDRKADRLEIPVVAARIDPITGEPIALRIAAVLSFSRAARGSAETEGAMQDVRATIQEQDVAPVKPLLVGLVERLRRALFRDRQRQFIRMHSDIRKQDHAIHSARDLDAKKQLILDALLAATGADHLILVTQERGGILKPDGVANREGVESVPDFGLKVETPLSDNTFAVVQVWNERCAKFCHDGPHSPHVEAVVERYGQSPRKDEQRWAEWTGKNVGSAITYPITVDDRTIGVFILYFRTAWRTTQSLIWAIESVAHRCRWVVQSIIAERERASWLQALGHELRRDLYTADHALTELQQAKTLQVTPDADSQKRWRRFRRNFVNATALADNWLDMMRGLGRAEPGSAFPVGGALDAYIELNKDYHDDLVIAWKHEPGRSESIWQSELIYQMWFERVIRVVLDNASKFGRAWIDGQHDEAHEVDLRLSARLLDDQSRFELRIRNPGCMNPTQYQYRFDSGVPNDVRAADGAHVGLHTARKLAHAVGGELSLENLDHRAVESTDGPTVEACLIWPRACNKEQCA